MTIQDQNISSGNSKTNKSGSVFFFGTKFSFIVIFQTHYQIKKILTFYNINKNRIESEFQTGIYFIIHHQHPNLKANLIKLKKKNLSLSSFNLFGNEKNYKIFILFIFLHQKNFLHFFVSVWIFRGKYFFILIAIFK